MIAETTAAVRRPTRLSIVVGVLVLLLVTGGGGALAVLQPASFTAQSSFVVLPQPGLSTADSASYYETLSRGQIAATFAEIAANSTARQDAIGAVGLSPSIASSVTDEITVVPNTSVILVSVTASQADVAERVSDSMTTGIMQDLAAVAKPYALSQVASAKGQAYRVGPTPLVVLVVALIVGVVAAILVQQLVYQLVLAFRRRGPARRPAATSTPTVSDAPVPAAEPQQVPTGETPVLAGRR